MSFNRRRFVQAAGAVSLGSALPAMAQAAPIRLGLMTVKTGPLASGGIDMERALVQFLKEHSNTLAGRARWNCSSATAGACRRRRAPRSRSWSSATGST